MKKRGRPANSCDGLKKRSICAQISNYVIDVLDTIPGPRQKNIEKAVVSHYKIFIPPEIYTPTNPPQQTPNLICVCCNHQWQSRVENPVSCPRCKNPNWNKPKKNK